jgi:branched-chain amino acid transport system substrate-binding protein
MGRHISCAFMSRLSLLMIICTVLFAACGGEDAGSGSTGTSDSGHSETGVTKTEIILGSHNDLSGPLALIGTASINGARMRFDEVNAAGGIHGRKIRLIVEDTSYQVPRAIQAVNKLINRDKIFAMIMGMGTPTNNAAMPRLFEKGIPNLIPLTNARSMREPFRPLQFTASGSYYHDIGAAAKYLIESGQAATPCVIYQDTDYGQEILEGAHDQLELMGMTPAAVSAHRPADSEFTTAILRLRNAGCDLVLMGTVHKDTVLILETARKMGWEGALWVGTEASFSRSIAELPSGGAEGYMATSGRPLFYLEDENPPEVAEWLDRYVEKYGSMPEYMAIVCYSAADLIVEALRAAGPDLTRESFITALESMHDYKDVFGHRLSYSPDNHNGLSESTLSVVRDGRWRILIPSIKYSN